MNIFLSGFLSSLSLGMITIKFYLGPLSFFIFGFVSELLLCWRYAVQRSNVLHSLGNTSHHFRAVERPLSGRRSANQSEATEHWRSPGLFRVMRFISSRNTNGPENQVVEFHGIIRKLVSRGNLVPMQRSGMQARINNCTRSTSIFVGLELNPNYDHSMFFKSPGGGGLSYEEYTGVCHVLGSYFQ